MATQRLVAAKGSGHDARFPGVAMPIGIEVNALTPQLRRASPPIR